MKKLSQPWNMARTASKRRVHARSVFAPVVGASPTLSETVPLCSAGNDYISCDCGYQTCRCDADRTLAKPEQKPPSETSCTHSPYNRFNPCPTCGWVPPHPSDHALDCGDRGLPGGVCHQHSAHREAWLAKQKQARGILPPGWQVCPPINGVREYWALSSRGAWTLRGSKPSLVEAIAACWTEYGQDAAAPKSQAACTSPSKPQRSRR